MVAGAAPSKGRSTSAGVISRGDAAVAGEGVLAVQAVRKKITSGYTQKDFFMFPLAVAYTCLSDIRVPLQPIPAQQAIKSCIRNLASHDPALAQKAFLLKAEPFQGFGRGKVAWVDIRLEAIQV